MQGWWWKWKKPAVHRLTGDVYACAKLIPLVQAFSSLVLVLCCVLFQGRVWPSAIFVRAHWVARNGNSLTDAQEQESGGGNFEGGEPHGSIYYWGQGHCLTSWDWKIAPELLEPSFPLDLHGWLSLLLSADLYHYYLYQYLCIILSYQYFLYSLTSARLWFLLS